MRIRIEFEVTKETLIPYNYQYAINSWLYRCIQVINPELSEWLHREGLHYRNKRYKPLVFSRLFFEHRVKNKKQGMIINGIGHFFVDSMKKEIVQSIITGAWKVGKLELLHHQFPMVKVTIHQPPDFNSVNTYTTLSPIVVPVQENGRLHYCHPLESRFYDSLRRSLANWYFLYWKEEPTGEDLSIDFSILTPETYSLRRSADLIEYKGKYIKGYRFDFKLYGTSRMKEVAYHTGLGSYGSLGYGMIEINDLSS